MKTNDVDPLWMVVLAGAVAALALDHWEAAFVLFIIYLLMD